MKKNLRFLFVLILCLFVVGCGNVEKSEKKEEEYFENKYSEVGAFTSYEGDLYYWKLNGNSRSKSAQGAAYRDLVGAENQLVKVDSKGNESVIYTGEGSKEVVISNNKIYTSRTSDEYENSRVIYSIDFNGENKKEIGNGYMSDIISERYIIGNVTKYDDQLFMIDTKNDEYSILRENAVVVEAKDNSVYFYDKSDRHNIVIGVINDKGEVKELISIDTSYFKYSEYVTVLNVERLILGEDTIEAYVDYRDGSANLIQELKKFTIDYEGKLISDEFIDDMSFEDELTRDEVIFDFSHFAYRIQNESYKMMTVGELGKKFGLPLTGSSGTINASDEYLSLYKGNVIGKYVYFIIDYSSRDADSDIGWRYGYKREKTYYVRYDIESKEYSSIYEF